MRFTEAVLIIPRFFLVLMVIAVVGTNTMLLIAIIGLTSWPSSARLLRAEILSLRELEFVESARAMGSSNARIMVRHLLPNALHPVVVNGTLGIASAILLEAGLSFLGLGDPSVVSWGQMLQNAQQYFTRAWWMSVFPGAAIFVTVLAFNLVGDGLNDVLNPKITD
jgi:peptide/nickel transport system permease protein